MTDEAAALAAARAAVGATLWDLDVDNRTANAVLDAFDAAVAAPPAPLPLDVDPERLARAILAARSTTARWKGAARATEPTRWDRLMAKRVLLTLATPELTKP